MEWCPVPVGECFLNFLTCQVSTVLADAWEYLRGDPVFKLFCLRKLGAKYQRIKTSFVDKKVLTDRPPILGVR